MSEIKNVRINRNMVSMDIETEIEFGVDEILGEVDAEKILDALDVSDVRDYVIGEGVTSLIDHMDSDDQALAFHHLLSVASEQTAEAVVSNWTVETKEEFRRALLKDMSQEAKRAVFIQLGTDDGLLGSMEEEEKESVARALKVVNMPKGPPLVDLAETIAPRIREFRIDGKPVGFVFDDDKHYAVVATAVGRFHVEQGGGEAQLRLLVNGLAAVL